MQAGDNNSKSEASLSWMKVRETGWRGTGGRLKWRPTSSRLDNNPQMDAVGDFSISVLGQKTRLVVTPMKRLQNEITETCACATKKRKKKNKRFSLTCTKHSEMTAFGTRATAETAFRCCVARLMVGSPVTFSIAEKKKKLEGKYVEASWADSRN